jgi:hypothetical protein
VSPVGGGRLFGNRALNAKLCRPQKGLAFHWKRSMYVVIARAILPLAITSCPDALSVRGSSQ